jgi:hypothetical protein
MNKSLCKTKLSNSFSTNYHCSWAKDLPLSIANDYYNLAHIKSNLTVWNLPELLLLSQLTYDYIIKS